MHNLPMYTYAEYAMMAEAMAMDSLGFEHDPGLGAFARVAMCTGFADHSRERVGIIHMEFLRTFPSHLSGHDQNTLRVQPKANERRN
jgi:hypothetical protein